MRVPGKISGMTHNTYKNYLATRNRKFRDAGCEIGVLGKSVFLYPASRILHLDLRVSRNISGMTQNTYKISLESHNGKFRHASCATEILANNKYQAPAIRIVGMWESGCGMKNYLQYLVMKPHPAMFNLDCPFVLILLS